MSSSRFDTFDEQQSESQLQQSNVTPPAPISTSRLETALKSASKQALRYECQMKDLESRLSENLGNFRAIESQLQEAYTSVSRNTKRADRSLITQVPTINTQLDMSVTTLKALENSLPKVQTQVEDIKDAYDSGRKKAVDLVHDLTWLNTEFYERWRMIIFTSKSPVSFRWKVIMRMLFAISFITCTIILWIALSGAYRAHRHRLVWGEKLMS